MKFADDPAPRTAPIPAPRVFVIGAESLALAVEQTGARVVRCPNPRVLDACDDVMSADAVDAIVIEAAPWPKSDGVELARGLRRRQIGTVVIAGRDQRSLLDERLAVVPPDDQDEILGDDLEAAIAVAAQETWTLKRMRARPKARPASDERETVVDTPLSAPPAPPAPQVQTREWAPSGSLLAKLAVGAGFFSRPRVETVVTRRARRDPPTPLTMPPRALARDAVADPRGRLQAAIVSLTVITGLLSAAVLFL